MSGYLGFQTRAIWLCGWVGRDDRYHLLVTRDIAAIEHEHHRGYIDTPAYIGFMTDTVPGPVEQRLLIESYDDAFRYYQGGSFEECLRKLADDWGPMSRWRPAGTEPELAEPPRPLPPGGMIALPPASGGD